MGLIYWWDYSLWGAKRNGRIDGNSNIPGKNQTDFAPYELQLASIANCNILLIAEKWLKNDSRLMVAYCNALHTFNEAKVKVEKAQEILLEKECVHPDPNLFNGSSYDARIGKWFYRMIILMIAAAEFPFANNAMELMGENQIITYLLALGPCFLILFGAHLAGRYLKTDMYLKEKRYTFINLFIMLFIIAVVMMIFGISMLLGYFHPIEEDIIKVPCWIALGKQKLTMVIFTIQGLLFALAVIASYKAHDRDSYWAQVRRKMMKDTGEDSNESKATKEYLAARVDLDEAKVLREKTFEMYKNQSEQVLGRFRTLIEAYRGENVRARGDAEVSSFKNYPLVTLPENLMQMSDEIL
jgi:hypothetical protein